MSEYMLQTIMRFSFETYVTYENIMSCFRTYITYKMYNVRTYVTHEYEIIMRMFSVRTNGTYENV